MLNCCSKNFKDEEVWFLFDSTTLVDSRLEMFINNKLHIGVCPNCFCIVAEKIRERRSDGRIFSELKRGLEAKALIDETKKEKEYSSLDLRFKKGSPYGFVYGENTEGKTSTKQYAKDYYGQRRLVKTTIKKDYGKQQ